MSGLYLLDTDTCAFVLRRSCAALLRRIQSVPLAQQAMSVVTYAELLYGVQVSSKKKANQEAVDALVRFSARTDEPVGAGGSVSRVSRVTRPDEPTEIPKFAARMLKSAKSTFPS